MKKTRILGLLAVVLALSLVLAGCGGGDSDSWADITSLYQLHGTWQGSYDDSMLIKQFAEQYMGDSWNSGMQNLFGNIDVKIHVQVVYNINAGADALSGTETATMVFSGGNINIAWPLIKSSLNGYGFTVNDSNHSAIYAETIGPVPVLTRIPTGSKINQNETKLKIPTSSFGLKKDFILNRQ
jgi:hypothetical protein